jgi:hypothetical protein
MSYRDDREALLQRVEALERELAQTREERGAARDELALVLAKQALQEAERVVEDEADEQPPVPSPPLALVAVHRDREHRSLQPLIAASVVALGWTVLAVAVGAAAWMLPAVVISAAGAARLAQRDHVRVVVGELEKRWPSLPIDQDTYRELLALPRRTVVVRVAVAFEKLPSRGEREKIKQRVKGLGAVTWEQATLTIASGTLRTSKGKADRWAFDPEVLRAYCARVFDALVGVHAEHPIANVWPRARSR